MKKLTQTKWRRSTVILLATMAAPLVIVACGGAGGGTFVKPELTTCPASDTAQSHTGNNTHISFTSLPTQQQIIVPPVPLQTGTTTENPTGGTLTIAIPEDVTTNNPWAVIGPDSTAYNFAAYLNRYPAPMALSDVKYQWIPGLAADYPTPLEREGDFWVSTITFKDGITWSDGEPITADDVAFTVNTVIDLQLTGNWSTTVDRNFVDRVEVVPGQNAAKYYLKATDSDGNPQTPGLSIWQYGVTQAAILPEHFWAPQIEGLGDCATDDADCLETRRTALNNLSADNEPVAGPASFVEWQEGAFVALESNRDSYIAGSSTTQYGDGRVEEVVQGTTYNWLSGTQGGSATEVDLEVERPISQDDTIYSVFTSQDAAVLALRDGEADYFLSPLGLSRGLLAQVEGSPGITTFQNPSNGFRYLAFNFDREPFNDCALRQAVALLIDRDLVATSILQGAVSPIYTTVPEGNAAWFNSDVEQIGSGLTREERINRVVELLTEAGYTWDTPPSWDADNRRVVAGEGLRKPDGTPITQRERQLPDGTTEIINTPFELLSPGNGYDPLRATYALVIEQALNEAGILTDANLTGFNEIVDKVFSGATDDGARALRNFDLWILGWGLTPYPDHLVNFFSEANSGPGGQNAGGFVSADFEALVSQFNQATDVEEARRLNFEMQALLARELPYVTLFSTPIIEAYRPASIEFAYTEVLDGVQNLFSALDGPLSNTLIQTE